MSDDARLERVDPAELDLVTADALAEVLSASDVQAGLSLPPRVGGAVLAARRLQFDGRPVDGVWLAWRGERLVGHVDLTLPHQENTSDAQVRGHVHPDVRRRGIGRSLLDVATDVAREAGRTRLYAGAFVPGDGPAALESWGFQVTPGRYAVRRVSLHDVPPGRWEGLVEEAATSAGDYELLRMVGPTPGDRLEEMAALHESINDAPSNDVDEEPARFDAARVRAYDEAMSGRRQTTYRVVARHRTSGDWVGLSLLCVDEFSPTLGIQEDTSVVRAHRGHRLGLLMKAEMLRWISADRPEVDAIDTFNAVTNHHMIAVNERLGARVVAELSGYRRDLAATRPRARARLTGPGGRAEG